MKLIYFSPLLLLFFLFSCEVQKAEISAAEVPAAVREAFLAAHPGTKVEWEAEAGAFEAEFKVDGQEITESYSATGQLLESEVEIKKSELPAAILTTISEQFPDYEIEEAARITYSDGRIAYEAEIQVDDDVSFDAIFAADGRLLERKSTEHERGEDKE